MYLQSPLNKEKLTDVATLQLNLLHCVNKAAAAAQSLQSCPTLCDPRDGSLTGSPVPGIQS